MYIAGLSMSGIASDTVLVGGYLSAIITPCSHLYISFFVHGLLQAEARYIAVSSHNCIHFIIVLPWPYRHMLYQGVVSHHLVLWEARCIVVSFHHRIHFIIVYPGHITTS